jgi:hypothetical protein
MVAVSQFAVADIAQRPEFALSEQAYYDRYVRPYAESAQAEVSREGGAARRGFGKTQQQFMTARFGRGAGASALGGTSQKEMAPFFRRLMQERMTEAQAEEDQRAADLMKEREALRARGQQQLGAVTSIESGLASLIPYAGPYISGATSLGGALMQARLGQEGASTGRPLRMHRFADSSMGDGSDERLYSPGGSGEQDLYNLTYG